MAKIEEALEKTICISTAHMPSNDALSNTDIISVTWDYGGWVHVCSQVNDNKLSWLVPIISLAIRAGATWIRFDCDALTIDGLETYVW